MKTTILISCLSYIILVKSVQPSVSGLYNKTLVFFHQISCTNNIPIILRPVTILLFLDVKLLKNSIWLAASFERDLVENFWSYVSKIFIKFRFFYQYTWTSKIPTILWLAVIQLFTQSYNSKIAVFQLTASFHIIEVNNFCQ